MDETTPDVSMSPAWEAEAPSANDAEPSDTLQLHRISTLLIGERDVATLYGHMIDAAIDILDADLASLQVFDPERNELQLLIHRGFHPDSAKHWEWVGLETRSSCGLSFKSGKRVLVPDTEEWDLVAGTPVLAEYRRSGIRAMQSTPLIARSGKLVGMISTHWHRPHRPSERRLHALDVIARQAADLIERSRIEEALRISAERYRWLASIVESSDDAIIGKDADGVITSWNRAAERIYGYTAAEAIGQHVTLLIPPELHGEERELLERIARGERIEGHVTERRRKDGSLFTISMTESPIRDEAGRVIGASKIARDITQQKKAEERVATLAREAEHRTKNILATVQATINLSRGETPEDLKKAIVGRIRALANVHSLFVDSRWHGAELSSLARQELAPYREAGSARVSLDGPEVLLDPDAAQTIAIALHELTTNAAKYGALSVPEGRVEIVWSRQAAGGLSLRWTESGGPPVSPPTRRGFGTRVLDQAVRGILGGTVSVDWRPAGLVCVIDIRT